MAKKRKQRAPTAPAPVETPDPEPTPQPEPIQEQEEKPVNQPEPMQVEEQQPERSQPEPQPEPVEEEEEEEEEKPPQQPQHEAEPKATREEGEPQRAQSQEGGQEEQKNPQETAEDGVSANRGEEEEQKEEKERYAEGGEVKKEAEEPEKGQNETLELSNEAVKSEPDVKVEANGAGNEGNATEEEEEDVDDEPLEKLLEPFGKEQLTAIVRKAVDKHPDLMDSVREIADMDPAHRKIFVHGLGWDTTAETLRIEFGKYGEIEDCKAVTDRVSGKSKGYGFILFKFRSGARKALKQPQKKIGNRITSCQLATMGPVPAPSPATQPVSEYTQRKIFVSNVSAEIDPERLTEFFRQFGEIEEGPLGLDKQTGRPKGFALYVYRSVEGAKRALEEPHKNFEGYTLHCQKAIDGPKHSKLGYGGGAGAGGSGYHHQQQHHHHQSSHYQPPAKKGKYSSGGSGHGHLMAPSGPSAGYSSGVPAQGLNPVLGQALTALIATQGAGMGVGNLLGGIGGAPMNQGAPPPASYMNQAGGGYGNQQVMQGGYANPQMNPQMGQGGTGRPQHGAPYMGH